MNYRTLIAKVPTANVLLEAPDPRITRSEITTQWHSRSTPFAGGDVRRAENREDGNREDGKRRQASGKQKFIK